MNYDCLFVVVLNSIVVSAAESISSCSKLDSVNVFDVCYSHLDDSSGSGLCTRGGLEEAFLVVENKRKENNDER